MNIISKSLSYIAITLLSSVVFFLGPSVLGNTILGIPLSQGCHSEKNTTSHNTNIIQQQEQAGCCDTGLCSTGICCAYITPGVLYMNITSHPELIYKQKGKIFGFSTTTQSIIQPPG